MLSVIYYLQIVLLSNCFFYVLSILSCFLVASSIVQHFFEISIQNGLLQDLDVSLGGKSRLSVNHRCFLASLVLSYCISYIIQLCFVFQRYCPLLLKFKTSKTHNVTKQDSRVNTQNKRISISRKNKLVQYLDSVQTGEVFVLSAFHSFLKGVTLD